MDHLPALGAALLLMASMCACLYAYRREVIQINIIDLRHSDDPEDVKLADFMQRKHDLYLHQLTAKQRLLFWSGRGFLILGNAAVLVYLMA